MTDKSLYDLSIFALNLAMHAGEIMMQERSLHPLQHQYKNNDELVTQADIKVDEFITKQIRKNYPEHRIVSEEGSPDYASLGKDDRPTWIIDPIDGTVNYAHHQFNSAVSIAYAEKGTVQVGVVHCPFLRETFHALRGTYVVMNHKPIQVSGQTDLRRALIATGFPYHKEDNPILIRRLGSILDHCQDIRRLGSAAIDICWVAMGRLDGYYETLKPWDFAAARLIAEEAGATCGHFSDVPEQEVPEFYGSDILITTPELFQGLRGLLLAG